MKQYKQPTLKVKLYEADVITASITFDEYDYYTQDPFSDVEIVEE